MSPTNVESDPIAIRSNPKTHCTLCRGEGKCLYSNLTDRLFGAPGEWNLKRCTNPGCGLVWLDPMPIEEDIGKAYQTSLLSKIAGTRRVAPRVEGGFGRSMTSFQDRASVRCPRSSEDHLGLRMVLWIGWCCERLINLTVLVTLIGDRSPLEPWPVRQDLGEFHGDLPAQCWDRVRHVPLGSSGRRVGYNFRVRQVFRGSSRIF